MTEPEKLKLDDLIATDGPFTLVVTALLKPIADMDRFQPAGFPEIGHVIYQAPRADGSVTSICIVDSPASMANHLETVCLSGPGSAALHPELLGLPHVVTVTDGAFERTKGTITLNKNDAHDRIVMTTLNEAHRIASDYFLDGLINPEWKEPEGEKPKKSGSKKGVKATEAGWTGTTLREHLRAEFGLIEVKRDSVYFAAPEQWFTIYKTLFRYDPNSLVHGVLFPKEQIKLSRILTAHLEAFGAKRVARSGVKFDRLQQTASGQPIFAVDEETAREIRATFIIDLGLLRSYGSGKLGLSADQKKLVLGLALWKVRKLLDNPFRYRTQCHLQAGEPVAATERRNGLQLPDVNMQELIASCFRTEKERTPLEVYFPANKLFKIKDEKKTDDNAGATAEDESGDDDQ